ncbi:MAG: ABC transporter permease [Chlorobiaceae bacterium]|nr:ABC transporter permease [Chlorobiaceae bacterium]
MNKNITDRFQWKDRLLGLILPVALLFAWQGLVNLKLYSDLILVPPLKVVGTLVYLAGTGELTTHILISLQRVLTGFLIGASSGFLLGLLMGLSATINRSLGPFIKALKQVPEFAWMPMIILVFGMDELAKDVFIAIGAFYPMVFNTYQGVSGVPHKYQELARVFDFKNIRFLQKVVLPSALPSILTGLRLSIGLSWMFVVGAELFGTESGIGYMMYSGREMFQIDVVIAGLVVIGAIGFIMNALLKVVENRVLVWNVSVEGGQG